ncbi:MAG: hypothetical protein GXP46_07920 [Deferribacteres bacterium]|nr:hypothetical protein [Deferribacteres bacterium]
MKYYLDEDLNPMIAEILGKDGIDAVSAKEAGMLQASDLEQLKYAASKKRCMVTKNRNDFIRLTVRFFNESLPHYGLLVIPASYPGDRFNLISKALKKYALQHREGMSPYSIDFL